MGTRRDWIIAGVTAICCVTGVALSHLIQPRVGVEKVTLVEDTPALKSIPTGRGPYPVADFDQTGCPCRAATRLRPIWSRQKE